MAIEKLKDYAGFASLALGGIMFIFGGYNVLKSTTGWGERLADKIESYASISESNISKSKNEMPQTNKEAKDEMDYILINSALLLAGAGFGGLGAALVLTRTHRDYEYRDTRYKSFSDYKHESQVKGSKENPYEIY